MTPSLQLIASGNSHSSAAQGRKRHLTDNTRPNTHGLLPHPSRVSCSAESGWPDWKIQKTGPYLSPRPRDTSTRSAPRADGITTPAAVLGRSPHPTWRSQPTASHPSASASIPCFPFFATTTISPATTLGTRMQLGTLARHHRLRHHQAPQHLLFIFFPPSARHLPFQRFLIRDTGTEIL
jgi:hypothetical protein